MVLDADAGCQDALWWAPAAVLYAGRSNWMLLLGGGRCACGWGAAAGSWMRLRRWCCCWVADAAAGIQSDSNRCVVCAAKSTRESVGVD